MWKVFGKKKSEFKGEEVVKKERNEQYHTPQWLDLRERLVRERGSICEKCGKKSYMMLHHKGYCTNSEGKKRDIWNYPDENFLCLCGDCHYSYHTKKASLNFKAEENEDLRDRIADANSYFGIEGKKTAPIEQVLDLVEKIPEKPKKVEPPEDVKRYKLEHFFSTRGDEDTNYFQYYSQHAFTYNQALFLVDILEKTFCFPHSGRKSIATSGRFLVEVILDLLKKDKQLLDPYLTKAFLDRKGKEIWGRSSKK